MTQSARARRNYSCCFASLQLFKENNSYSNAGCWHMSAGQTVSAVLHGSHFVYSRPGSTGGSALHTCSTWSGYTVSGDAVHHILMVTGLQPKSHALTLFSPWNIKNGQHYWFGVSFAPQPIKSKLNLLCSMSGRVYTIWMLDGTKPFI